MKGFIYALIGLVPSFLRSPAQWIADRIFAVLDDGVRFARWVGGAFYALALRVIWFVKGIQQLAYEAYYSLRWVITVWVPARIADAVRLTRNWAMTVIGAVERAIRATVATLDRWAKAAIAFVANTLRDFSKWAIDKVSWLWNHVTSLIRRVFDDWGTPARLAAWILAPIVTLFLRYLYQQRDRIATWLLRSSVPFTRWLAVELEKILVRLL